MPDRTVAPYGAWRSLIRIDDVVGDVIVLGEPWIDGDDVYWLEGRPTEGGRRVLVRAAADGSTADLTPAAVQRPDPRPRVRRRLVRRRRRGRRLLRVRRRSAVPARPGRRGRSRSRRPARGATRTCAPDLARRRFYAVREDHGRRRRREAVVNTIVADPARRRRSGSSSSSGPDFVAAPRLSPDGSRLCWLEWDHPDMPWDATRLRVAPIEPDGTLGESTLAAGGPDESIVQPEWATRRDAPPDQRPDRLVEPVPARRRPAARAARADGGRVRRSVLDLRSVVVRVPAPTARSSAVGRARTGRDHLFHIEPGRLIGEVEIPFTELDAVRVGADAASSRWPAPPTDPCRRRPVRPGRPCAVSGVLRRASTVTLDPATISRPEPIEFPTTATGPRTRSTTRRRTRPSRGAGRRAAAARRPVARRSDRRTRSTALDLGKQLLTSRGIAVVDVDYGGSTGYGRDYRRRLDGQWGIVDVDDCVAAARFLVERGDVDPRPARPSRAAAPAATRRSRRWRSATCSRRASACYGVGDLELLAQDTHKFESHYEHRMVGPYPEGAAIYRERSPIHFGRPDPLPGARPPGPRRPGRAAGAGRGHRRRAGRQRHPARLPRVRGRGPRVPRRRTPIRRTLEAEPVVPRPGLRVRAGRRHRAARPARASTPGANGGRGPRRPPG